MIKYAVRITEPSRRALFLRLFRTDTVAVVSDEPVRRNPPGGGPARKYYLLDMEQIGDPIRERLVRYIADEQEMSWTAVLMFFDRHGVPISAEDCEIVINDPVRWAL